MSKNVSWKKTKNFLREEYTSPIWAISIVIFVLVALIVLANQQGEDEGYWKGYNQALDDEQETILYNIYLNYSFEEKKEMFWSTIMWDVANNTKTIFIIVCFLMFLRALTR